MSFDPHHPIIQLCLQGMAAEEKNEPEEAVRLFAQAWNEAANDYERFLAAYYQARTAGDLSQKRHWLETALQGALAIDDNTVRSALPALYHALADCRAALGDAAAAAEARAAAEHYRYALHDSGPFYHGTRADLPVGGLLSAGFRSNYHPDVVMNHIYFTALVNGAGLAAALAQGEGEERVYLVTPTGPFENDPNVTDKKFPGNPTRSYRSTAPLRILGEVHDWVRLTPEQRAQWKEKLARFDKGDIIN